MRFCSLVLLFWCMLLFLGKASKNDEPKKLINVLSTTTQITIYTNYSIVKERHARTKWLSSHPARELSRRLPCTTERGNVTCCAGTYFATKTASSSEVDNKDNRKSCLPCQIGRFQDIHAHTQLSCKKCTTGMYNNETGLEKCLSMKLGLCYTSSDNKTVCVGCSAGKNLKRTVEKSRCINCVKGQFTDAIGIGTCSRCVLGTYKVDPFALNSSLCNNCTSKAKCSKNGVCVEGFDSKFGCTTCAKNHVGKRCRKCPSAQRAIVQDSVLVVVGIYMLFSLLYLVYYEVEQKDEDEVNDDVNVLEQKDEDEVNDDGNVLISTGDLSQDLKDDSSTVSQHGKKVAKIKSKKIKKIGSAMRRIFVNQMLILSAILPSINWSDVFPVVFIEVLENMTAFFSLDLSSFLTSHVCGTVATVRTQWLIGLLLPVMLGFVLQFWATVAIYLQSDVKIIARISVRLLLLGLYKNSIETSLKILNCETTVNGVVILAMDSGQCPLDIFSGKTDTGLLYAIFGIIMLFIYGILPYLYITVQLLRYGRPSDSDTSSWSYVLFGWASSGYKPSAYIWEPVNALIIFLTVSASELLVENQRLAQGLVAGSSIVLHLVVRPYDERSGNLLVVLFSIAELLAVLGADEDPILQIPFLVLLVLSILLLLKYSIGGLVNEVLAKREQIRTGMGKQDKTEKYYNVSKIEKYMLVPFAMFLLIPLGFVGCLTRGLTTIASMLTRCRNFFVQQKVDENGEPDHIEVCDYWSLIFIGRLLAFATEPLAVLFGSLLFVIKNSPLKAVMLLFGLDVVQLEQEQWRHVKDLSDVFLRGRVIRNIFPELRGTKMTLGSSKWAHRLQLEIDDDDINLHVLTPDITVTFENPGLCGMHLSWNIEANFFRVSAVDLNGDAYNLGVREGLVVFAINGLRVAKVDMSAFDITAKLMKSHIPIQFATESAECNRYIKLIFPTYEVDKTALESGLLSLLELEHTTFGDEADDDTKSASFAKAGDDISISVPEMKSITNKASLINIYLLRKKKIRIVMPDGEEIHTEITDDMLSNGLIIPYSVPVTVTECKVIEYPLPLGIKTTETVVYMLPNGLCKSVCSWCDGLDGGFVEFDRSVVNEEVSSFLHVKDKLKVNEEDDKIVNTKSRCCCCCCCCCRMTAFRSGTIFYLLLLLINMTSAVAVSSKEKEPDWPGIITSFVVFGGVGSGVLYIMLLLICSHELPKGLEDMSVVHSPIVQVNNVRCKRKRMFQKIEDVEELAKKVNGEEKDKDKEANIGEEKDSAAIKVDDSTSIQNNKNEKVLIKTSKWIKIEERTIELMLVASTNKDKARKGFNMFVLLPDGNFARIRELDLQFFAKRLGFGAAFSYISSACTQTFLGSASWLERGSCGTKEIRTDDMIWSEKHWVKNTNTDKSDKKQTVPVKKRVEDVNKFMVGNGLKHIGEKGFVIFDDLSKEKITATKSKQKIVENGCLIALENCFQSSQFSDLQFRFYAPMLCLQPKITAKLLLFDNTLMQGFSLDGEGVVQHVAKNCVARKQGIRKGMCIAAVNGLSAKSQNIDFLKFMLFLKKCPKPLVLHFGIYNSIRRMTPNKMMKQKKKKNISKWKSKMMEHVRNRIKSQQLQEDAEYAVLDHQYKTQLRHKQANLRLQKRITKRNGTMVVPCNTPEKELVPPIHPTRKSKSRSRRKISAAPTFTSNFVESALATLQTSKEVAQIHDRSQTSRKILMEKIQKRELEAEAKVQKRLLLRTKAKQKKVLKQCTPFMKITEHEQDHIVDLMKYIKIKAGEVLCQQGDVANQMYLLMKGDCVVNVDGSDLGKLKEFDVFGEQALFTDGKRTATVTAKNDIELLVLTRSNLKVLIRSGDLDAKCVDALEHNSKKRNSKNTKLLQDKAKETNALKESAVFAALTEESRSSIINLMDHLCFEEGDVLCVQGSISDCMYLLMSGSCLVTVATKKVGVLKELDVFGEGALFGTVRSATVVATEDLNVLALKREDLNSLIELGYLNNDCVVALKNVAKKRKKLNTKILMDGV